MRGVANQMRLQAALEAGRRVSSKYAIVTSYDPDTYSVKLKLQPEDTLTGWMPVGTQQVGNGWGLYAPPSQGDLVKVSFVDGDIESGVVECSLFNDMDRPLPVPSGELWLVSRGGAKIQLLATNALHIEAATITSAGGWAHTGNFTVAGDIELSGNLHTPQTITGDTDVIAAGKSGKNHTHGGVQPGAGHSLKPD